MSQIVWRKSSRSGGRGDCVEVAVLPDRVLVRDSKNPDGGALALTTSEWRTFASGINHGDFDL